MATLTNDKLGSTAKYFHDKVVDKLNKNYDGSAEFVSFERNGHKVKTATVKDGTLWLTDETGEMLAQEVISKSKEWQELYSAL